MHKLRVRAASRRSSLEEEVKLALKLSVEKDHESRGLATAIHELVAPYGGLELEIPPRSEWVPNTSIFNE